MFFFFWFIYIFWYMLLIIYSSSRNTHANTYIMLIYIIRITLKSLKTIEKNKKIKQNAYQTIMLRLRISILAKSPAKLGILENTPLLVKEFDLHCRTVSFVSQEKMKINYFYVMVVTEVTILTALNLK